ncbi:hypothetical protein ACA910_008910 [Epithemia clementina (nom. ined.)]
MRTFNIASVLVWAMLLSPSPLFTVSAQEVSVAASSSASQSKHEEALIQRSRLLDTTKLFAKPHALLSQSRGAGLWRVLEDAEKGEKKRGMKNNDKKKITKPAKKAAVAKKPAEKIVKKKKMTLIPRKQRGLMNMDIAAKKTTVPKKKKASKKRHGPKKKKGAPQATESTEHVDSKETEMDETIAMVYELCHMWEVFHNMGRRHENRHGDGFEWHDLCNDFEPLNGWLCPPEDIVANDICHHPRPHLSTAVRTLYCRPLTSFIIDNDSYRDKCERWCTNYVSQDLGHCCGISCG